MVSRYQILKIHLLLPKFAPDGYCGANKPEKISADVNEVTCQSCLRKLARRKRLM